MPLLVEQLTTSGFRQHAGALAEILRDSVEHGASVNFVLPFPIEQARAYWARRESGILDGEVLLYGAFLDGQLAGTVQLVLAQQPNGPHRAEISKMLVHSRARRKGIGRALLAAAEGEARRHGRTLLILDTEQDSAGDMLYRACGWVPFGVVEGYALDTAGVPRDCVFFKKVLA